MIYTYECPDHGEFDISMSVEAIVQEWYCPKCSQVSKKVIVAGHGIKCDSAKNVKWLDSACKTLLPDDHRPIETRGEFKRYLKDNGIEQRA